LPAGGDYQFNLFCRSGIRSGDVVRRLTDIKRGVKLPVQCAEFLLQKVQCIGRTSSMNRNCIGVIRRRQFAGLQKIADRFGGPLGIDREYESDFVNSHAGSGMVIGGRRWVIVPARFG
jgi:hypothetical protein